MPLLQISVWTVGPCFTVACKRSCPVPSLQVTQLGHVKDLATAFTKCLGNRKAYNQIYNISGVFLQAGSGTQAPMGMTGLSCILLMAG